MLPVLPVLPAVQSHTGKPVHLVIKGKLGLDRTASRAFDGPSPGDNEGVALIWKLGPVQKRNVSRAVSVSCIELLILEAASQWKFVAHACERDG